jgi:hypothetical protein
MKIVPEPKAPRWLHFEHTVTVGKLVGSLLKMQEPTLAQVVEVLSTAKVSWVTKAENAELDKFGFRSIRRRLA